MRRTAQKAEQGKLQDQGMYFRDRPCKSMVGLVTDRWILHINTLGHKGDDKSSSMAGE
jgi:hypothetical protein